jgi:hypothetical protein
VYNLPPRLAKNLSRGYKEKRSEGLDNQIMTHSLVRPLNDRSWSSNKSSFG